jgi:hypothetical protein
MKIFITTGLIFISTIGFAQDTTKVDYIKILKIDTIGGYFSSEVFSQKIRERYSVFGEFSTMMMSFPEGDYKPWEIKSICLSFNAPYPHWECYTPEEAEEKLNKEENEK